MRLKNVFRLVESAGKKYYHGDVKQPHRRGTRRGIAQIAAADVAGLDYITSWLCHGVAALAVDDIHFIMIRSGALAYDNTLTVFSFDDFAADRFRRAVRAWVAGLYMKCSLMICSIHRVVTHDIYIGRTHPAS